MSEKRRAAIITGSAHGIGRTIRTHLERKGWVVYGIDILPGEFFEGDLSDPEVIEAFVRAVLEREKEIHLLVNNAKPDFIGIDHCSYDEFVNALKVGAAAPFYLSKLLKDHFAKGASIINISSTRDSQSMAQSESYAAAKGAIASLTHAMAISLGPDVRVNAISPGWIETGNYPHSPADELQQPAGRVGETMDIAYLVEFLADEKKSGFITAQNIQVDGGMSHLMIYHDEHGWSFQPGESHD